MFCIDKIYRCIFFKTKIECFGIIETCNAHDLIILYNTFCDAISMVVRL